MEILKPDGEGFGIYGQLGGRFDLYIQHMMVI